MEDQNETSYVQDERKATKVDELLMLRKSKVFHTPHRSDQFKTKTTDGRKTAIIGEPA